jgi:hypothetical protein
MQARTLNSIGVCFNHEFRERLRAKVNANQTNGERSESLRARRRSSVFPRCTTTAALPPNHVDLSDSNQFQDSSRSPVLGANVLGAMAVCNSPRQRHAMSGCRIISRTSRRNWRRCSPEYRPTHHRPCELRDGPDAGAHRDAQSERRRLSRAPWLGQTRPIDNVAAGEASAIMPCRPHQRCPDQSSPRSRSSRRMGSGMAATLAAAALPRSGGAASGVK